MSKDKIARCIECRSVDFVDVHDRCEWCCETSEILYSTGMILAATPPAKDDDKTEAA